MTTSWPKNPGLAGIGAQDRGEDPDGGRLAGAVGPEQAEDRAGRHHEIDAVEGGDVPEPLDEAGGDNRGMSPCVQYRPDTWTS